MNDREAWLVYEINDIMYADIPFCSKSDMGVFNTKEEAILRMKERKENYILEDNDWTLGEETEDCITFYDDLQEGNFDIRLIKLA